MKIRAVLESLDETGSPDGLHVLQVWIVSASDSGISVRTIDEKYGKDFCIDGYRYLVKENGRIRTGGWRIRPSDVAIVMNKGNHD